MSPSRYKGPVHHYRPPVQFDSGDMSFGNLFDDEFLPPWERDMPGGGKARPIPELLFRAIRALDIEDATGQLQRFPGLATETDRGTGATALHLAAAYDSRPLIRALLATGRCDYTAKDNAGRTPALVARRFGSDPVISRLLAQKENRQRRGQAETGQ